MAVNTTADATATEAVTMLAATTAAITTGGTAANTTAEATTTAAVTTLAATTTTNTTGGTAALSRPTQQQKLPPQLPPRRQIQVPAKDYA